MASQTSGAPLPLVDIGANLSHASFRHDLETVIQQAKAAGVAHIIVTGTDLESISAARALVSHYGNHLTLTAGFHPHVASQCDDEALRQIATWLNEPAVVAVGETGLDYHRDFSPRPVQERVFARHLELAVACGKPVFLHQREAHSAFHSILRDFRDRLSGGVVHCFTDNREALFAYLDLDMFIGITGWICDERRGRHLQDLVASIPADRLLLETDAPYLLPRSLTPPPTTRRNEPRFLVEVLETVARCRQEPPTQVATTTVANAIRLFGLPLDSGNVTVAD